MEYQGKIGYLKYSGDSLQEGAFDIKNLHSSSHFGT